MADTEQVFAGFCQPCHGAAGEGLELGARPAAVPALASHLWRAYTHRDIMRHAIEEGRAGSLMEAFHSDQPDHDAILTQDEVDGLVDLLANGGLVAEPDPLAMTRVVPPSCVLCHFERGDYLEERGDDERLAFLTDHPWQWEVQDWLEDEGFAVASCDEDGVDEDGNPVAVHAGEALYTGLCVHCHEDPELGPAGYTPSAPNLRGCMQRPHFDAGYLLASITIGRPDAPATKWRHQGVTGGEYTPDQLVCLVRWLEDNP